MSEHAKSFLLSTASFISRGKLVSLKVFPLMYFKRSIFPLAVSCKPWQLTLSPLRWIQCYSPTAVRSHRPDRQLPGKTFSWVQTEPQSGSFGSQCDRKSNSSLWCSRCTWTHSLPQTTPTVTPTPTMACHSRDYYKFDNISNHCRKSANTNTC